MTRLNLGCSTQCVEGFVNVDRWTPPWATPENFQQADLRHSWPWADSSVDHIRAYDIIEHMPDPIHTMNELYRVLAPNGVAAIVVPTTDGRGAWQDPTHVSFWNRNSFFYYEEGNPHLTRFRDSNGVKCAFKILAERMDALDDEVVKLTIVLEAVKVTTITWNPEAPLFASDEERKEVMEATKVKTGDFAFSILHTSARPNEWKKVYDAWIDAAANPEATEYILVVDARWGFTETIHDKQDPLLWWPIEGMFRKDRPQDKVIWNTGRRCYVDGVNLAAEASTGAVLIVNADDQYPCDKWDERLTEAYLQFATISNSERESDFVIEVTTNTPTEHERGILVMPILSRERYERFGWVFFPQYEGMYADNDFCAMAKRDDCIIDARHLVFPHKHWINGQREKDEQDRAQNRDEAYEEGRKLFAARKRINFAGVPPQAPQEKPLDEKPIVVVLTPGNSFCAMWLDAFLTLFGYLIPKYNVSHWRQYTSNAAIVRNVMARGVMAMDYGAPVDYVLWIDDDNALTPEQFEMLIADLKAHPEYDAVTGWTWCGSDDNLDVGHATISCGKLIGLEPTEDHQDVKFTRIQPISPKEMYESPKDLMEIGYSGFPAVLMRFDLLEKAGKKLFTPYVDDRCEHGVSGEDIAFFARSTIRSGARYAVDRRVKVPHFKMRAIEPVPTAEQMQEALKKTAAQMAMR